jgi:hypothetical protein
MATLLENYYDRTNKFDSNILATIPGLEQVLQQQELFYRISVLEACQMFIKTSPKSADTKDLLWHYRILDAYFQNLIVERRFSDCTNEIMQKLRNTAHGNLLKVIEDYRKRFGSFKPGDDVDCYRKAISRVIQTVIPVWIQYRQTYIEITQEAE